MKTTAEKQRIVAVVIAALCILAALLVFRPGERASAGVDLADPNGWIEHGLAGEVLQVNGATGEIMSRVEVAEGGDQIRVVSHANGAAVLNHTSGELLLVDATLLSVTQKIELELADGAEDRDIEIFGGADVTDPVLVLDGDQLVSIDTQTGEVTIISSSSALISPIQDVDGRLMGLSGDPLAIKRLGPGGFEDLVELPNSVDDRDEDRSLVRVGAKVWLLDPGRLAAVEVLVDGTFGRPICVKSSANGADAGGSAMGDSATIGSCPGVQIGNARCRSVRGQRGR